MRVAVLQYDPVVGAVEENAERAVRALERLAGKADLLVLPELYLAGYPPLDLLERRAFLGRLEAALERVAAATASHPGTALVLGTAVATRRARGKGLWNAAVVLQDGRVAGLQAKRLLPTYDVFDENRYFDPGVSSAPVCIGGKRVGITICEDAFTDEAVWPQARYYEADPVADLAKAGVDLIVNISASPYVLGKDGQRFACMAGHAARHGVPFLYVNQVGGNDELVFDGNSFLADGRGRLVAKGPAFEEGELVVDVESTGQGGWPALEEPEALHRALVLGLSDYVRKTGFRDVVLGLSGGIDSAVVACLAASALGPEHVLGVAMPSRYSSPESVTLARRLAENLGIRFEVVPIEPAHQAYLDMLWQQLGWREGEVDVSQENLQARIRGNILMAFSNRFGSLVLSTGNKSELAVGYCTLYGDMSGGLAVISDVPKTRVYELARYINRQGEVIPEEILTRAPSAELRPGQKDTDSLPPYEVLDEILKLHIEENLCQEEVVAATGLDPGLVRRVLTLVQRNEYKRRQAPMAIKVTSKAFGMGRRVPVAARPGF